MNIIRSCLHVILSDSLIDLGFLNSFTIFHLVFSLITSIFTYKICCFLTFFTGM